MKDEGIHSYRLMRQCHLGPAQVARSSLDTGVSSGVKAYSGVSPECQQDWRPMQDTYTEVGTGNSCEQEDTWAGR